MGLPDSVVIKAALAANPALRQRLESLVSRVAGRSLSDAYLETVRRELTAALTLKELARLPNTEPTKGAPICLTSEQLMIVRNVLNRVANTAVRKSLQADLERAISVGILTERKNDS